MDTLFRLFVLKKLHGWDHETALVEYLKRRSVIREQLGIESIPDQSTLWRSWNTRFTKELRETIETVARTILITAQNASITIPREPDRRSGTTILNPISPTQTIGSFSTKRARSLTTSVASYSPRSRLIVVRAVRSPKMRIGICKRILGCERISP